MRRERTYVILRAVLLLSISLLVRSNWADEQDIISFISKKDEDRPIYLINIQGEVLQKLITEPGQPATFTWSPDGRSITYGSNRNGDPDIYVMDMRTNTHRQLTFGGRDLWPAWSPNGKWIAFVSERAADRDIYRMDVNGENVKRLTNQGKCGRPAWSPDSQWIAFVSTPNEGVIAKPFLFVMHADGRRLRQLAEAASFPHCTWAPSGKQIAFISSDAEGGNDIFSINVDGGNLRQLTWSDPLVLISSPVWSPSGKWIAYVLAQMPVELKPVAAAEIFANSVIYIVNTADGGRGEPLESTRGLITSSSLAWIPAKESFSVSPKGEKQMTLWGKLKQLGNNGQTDKYLNVIP